VPKQASLPIGCVIKCDVFSTECWGISFLKCFVGPKKKSNKKAATRATPQRPDKAIARISIVIPHSVGHSWT